MKQLKTISDVIMELQPNLLKFNYLKLVLWNTNGLSHHVEELKVFLNTMI